MESVEHDVTSALNRLVLNTVEEITEPVDENIALPTTLKPVFPVELEIEIISQLPFKYWGNLRQVCKRWHTITHLPDLLYLPITTQPPSAYDREREPNFKPVNFRIHRAIYEVAEYLGNDVGFFGFKLPDPRVCKRVAPYLDHPLTIPSLPHTLQDVKFNIMMPPRLDRLVRPGHVCKVIPVPCSTVRKLILVPHPTNNRMIEFRDMNGKQEPTGITVGEFYDSVAERSRVRPGDTYDKMLLTWRVRRPKTEWLWKEWGIVPGFYKLELVVCNKAVEQEQVSWTRLYRPTQSLSMSANSTRL